MRSKKKALVARCGGDYDGDRSAERLRQGQGHLPRLARGAELVQRTRRDQRRQLKDYVRGVVAKESPASWPIEALKAQAVAARSYAISTASHRGTFDVFDDTRSQAYGGVGAETPKTDQAVSATHLQVVLYQGKVAQTFFFSTSGGHTENNEFSSLGFGSRRSRTCGASTIRLKRTPDRRTSTGSGSSRSAG